MVYSYEMNNRLDYHCWRFGISPDKYKEIMELECFLSGEESCLKDLPWCEKPIEANEDILRRLT